MELNLTTDNTKSVCRTLGISKERESELDNKVKETLLADGDLVTTDLKTLAEFCTNLEEFAYTTYSYGVYVGAYRKIE